MNKRIFWVIIEAALEECGNDFKLQEKFIKKQLMNFELEDVLLFQVICKELMNGVYSSDIWAAAFVIRGTCSEDCFADFRGWLIAQGERAYMNAVNNPDSICDILDNYSNLENYDPQISLDLLLYDLVRKKWGLNQSDFKQKVEQLLSEKRAELISEINLEWDKAKPETLRKIVPRLAKIYLK